MITIKSKGSFDKTNKFLLFLYKRDFIDTLNKYAQQGVAALSGATPVDTGKTAASWGYKVIAMPNKIKIIWTNDNVDSNGTPIAILIQYGHSDNGYYVEGRDYINPVIQPLFDDIAEAVWKEVVNA